MTGRAAFPVRLSSSSRGSPSGLGLAVVVSTGRALQTSLPHSKFLPSSCISGAGLLSSLRDKISQFQRKNTLTQRLFIVFLSTGKSCQPFLPDRGKRAEVVVAGLVVALVVAVVVVVDGLV